MADNENFIPQNDEVTLNQLKNLWGDVKVSRENRGGSAYPDLHWNTQFSSFNSLLQSLGTSESSQISNPSEIDKLKILEAIKEEAYPSNSDQKPDYTSGDFLSTPAVGSEIFRDYINKIRLVNNDTKNLAACNACSGTCQQGCGENCVEGCSYTCGSGDVCQGQCSNFCQNGCHKECGSACVTTCTADCKNESCRTFCSNSCKGSCAKNCTLSCGDSSCGTQCQGGCSSSTCGSNCGEACGSDCEGSCSSNCSQECSGSGCHTSCTGCVTTCTSSCRTSCDNSANCKFQCSAYCGSFGSCGKDCSSGCNGTCSSGCTDGCNTGCFDQCASTNCTEECKGGCQGEAEQSTPSVIEVTSSDLTGYAGCSTTWANPGHTSYYITFIECSYRKGTHSGTVLQSVNDGPHSSSVDSDELARAIYDSEHSSWGPWSVEV